MATIKTKFNVGLFILVGISIIVLGVIWLGMSKYLEKGHFFVAYFDESVQGLDKDSPVKYRGVYIGRVHRIGVALDNKHIEVVMKIESELESQTITKNIVAQLKSVGITGLMFIELERKTGTEELIYPPSIIKPPYPVVATRPSEISKLFKGIDDVFAIFRALDSKTISDQLTMALKKVNKTLDNAQLEMMIGDVRDTLKNLQRLIQSDKAERMIGSLTRTSDRWKDMTDNLDGGISEIRTTVSRLDSILGASGNDIRQVAADLKSSAQQLKLAMENAATLLENTDAKVDTMQRQVIVTLERIEQAGDTLNRFLDRLAQEPSQIVFSGPAQEKPKAP